MAGKGVGVVTGSSLRQAERGIALGYAPPDRRAALAALLALDDTLARIVRTTREPIVGQMRLTWWFEALVALGGAPPPAEPVLAALAAEALPRGISGETLANMVDGWEALLDGDAPDARALETYAAARGGTLFAAMGRVLDGPAFPPLANAGTGWALADLSLHLSDPVQAAATRGAAVKRLASAFAQRWPVPLRPLGMLALLARADLGDSTSRPGSPRRLARMLMHRIWGR